MSTQKSPAARGGRQLVDGVMVALVTTTSSTMFVCDRLVLFVLFVVFQTTEGFTICHWGVWHSQVYWNDWSTWSACNHECGATGVQRRTRCKVTSFDDNTVSRPCNRGCVHGTPQDGYCSDCPAEYWGTCCDHRELSIMCYLRSDSKCADSTYTRTLARTHICSHVRLYIMYIYIYIYIYIYTCIFVCEPTSLSILRVSASQCTF